jgi:uncharacterized protein YcbK (DUF882 family)
MSRSASPPIRERGFLLPKSRSSSDPHVDAAQHRNEALIKWLGAKVGVIKSSLEQRSFFSKALAVGLFGSSLFLLSPASTESAVANGDTRTIYLYHAHTGESIDATYRVDGHYDPDVLKKLNWFLRDWRRNEETTMDPRLFDAVWEAYRNAGATQRIVVLCGYRSPETNAMLRQRSRAVAEHSQHILGKAMDTTMPGMSMERIRESAARLQLGGVGYYGDTNFVHIDVGGIRMWPRMSYAQLMRLFPDGKTVHIASDGRTLPGYEEARAELAENGQSVASLPPPQNSGIGAFFAWLFNKGNSGDDEDNATAQQTPAPQPAQIASAQEPAMQADATGSVPDTSADADSAAPAAATAVTPHIVAADMPLPPPRPTNLVASANVPLPPQRPTMELASIASPSAPPLGPGASDPIKTGSIVGAVSDLASTDLPGIITQGPNDGRPRRGFARGYGLTSQALAYAPVAQMEGLRSAAHDETAAAAPHLVARANSVTIVPARLDGSNFRSLTGSTDVAELASATIFGPTLTGLRSAARVEASALLDHPSAGYLSHFDSAVGSLETDRFSDAPVTAALRQDSDLALIDGRAGE